MDRGPLKPLKDLQVPVDSNCETLAKAICANLNENNEDLIWKIVTTLGNDRVIEYYNETKSIEENGGMLTVNGNRRKTPGGVFFYLINQDDRIPREILKELFADIYVKERQKKNQEIKERRRKKNDELKERLIKEGLLTTIRNNSEDNSSTPVDLR